MTLDSKFRPLATKLLSAYGKSVIYKRTTQGAYDPATGSVSTTTNSYPIHAMLQNPDDSQLATGQYRIDQVLATISAEQLGIEPSPNDKITIDGVDWNVSMVSFVSSGEFKALFTCVINK